MQCNVWRRKKYNKNIWCITTGTSTLHKFFLQDLPRPYLRGSLGRPIFCPACLCMATPQPGIISVSISPFWGDEVLAASLRGRKIFYMSTYKNCRPSFSTQPEEKSSVHLQKFVLFRFLHSILVNELTFWKFPIFEVKTSNAKFWRGDCVLEK